MRIETNLRTFAGALTLAALLAMPAVGCGPDEGDDPTPTPGVDPTDPPEATDPPQATETPAEATETPTGDAAFPEGTNYLISPWSVTFGQTYPYVLTAQADAVGDGTGGFTGTYYWIFWESQASYNADDGKDDPDCVFIESMTAVPHESGSNGDYNYASCQYCDDFWEVTNLWEEEHEGCSQELIDFWYLGEEGYVYDFSQYMGYRDAAANGWPGEFANFSSGLSDAGFTGTLYDELFAEEVGDFFPMYLVLPYEDTAERPMPELRQISVEAPAQARALLR